ncbi:MAG: hypothetical protein DCF16_17275 [Alphaproteobacteria bacterium]|nr:MAG: hypothetical protein DCF16_17275 [Alphaproteobacteria bacterium]
MWTAAPIRGYSAIGEAIMIRTLSIALIFALAACGQAATPTAETTAEAPTLDPHAPPVPSDDPVTAAFLVGSWGDNGDCTSTITYNADGSFRMADGSTGTWTLAGDRVTMSGVRGDFGVNVAKGNENQLLAGQPDGSFGISQRC